MSEKTYALIKGNDVIVTAIFDNPSEELKNHFLNYYEADIMIEATEKALVGGTYDGEKFWLPQPYPSWIKNEETNEWECSIPYPEIEEGSDEQYIWDENTTSWLLLPPSN